MDVPKFVREQEGSPGLCRVVFDSLNGPWSFTSRQTAARLRGDVISLWESHGFVDYSKEKILPTGCLDIIFNLGGVHETLDAANLESTGKFVGAWIAGIQDRPIIAAPTYCTLTHGTLLVGATLSPVGARRLLGIGGESFTNRVVELSDFVSTQPIADLRERLYRAGGSAPRLTLLESYLGALAIEQRRRVSDCVQWSAKLIDQSRGTIQINELSRVTDFSRKYINDKFKDELGLSPKHYARIKRFAAMMEELSKLQGVNWAQLALACGYYDQAHFVREFKQFSGLTPTEFFATRFVDGKTIVYD